MRRALRHVCGLGNVITRAELVALIREQCAVAGGIGPWCYKRGADKTAVGTALNAGGKIPPRVARSLGYREIVMYEPIGGKDGQIS